MEIINLGATDGLPPVNWGNVLEKLDAGSSPAPDAHNARTTWLSTLNGDGSPHVTAVGALWLNGNFWFQTGSGTRKARNVARDPRCRSRCRSSMLTSSPTVKRSGRLTRARSRALPGLGPTRGGPPNSMRPELVSARRSTRRRRDHLRGTSIESSHIR